MNPRWLCTAILVACGNSPAPPTIDAPTSAWSTGPVIPVPRLESGVTALGQSVVVVGGFDTDQQAGLDVTKRVDVFDTFDQTWSQLPDAPVARHHVQVAVVGTTLYLLGGLDAAADASLTFPARGDCYSIDTGDANPQWAADPIDATGRRARIGGGRCRCAADLLVRRRVDDRCDREQHLLRHRRPNGWCPGTACAPQDELPPLPAPRSHPAALRRVDGTFVVVGGLAGLASDTAQADVYVLPTDQQQASGTWTTGMSDAGAARRLRVRRDRRQDDLRRR